MTPQELTQNEKYKYWYLKIKECKESNLSVQEFCKNNNINQSTYYKYQQKIKAILCNKIDNENTQKREVAFIPVKNQTGNGDKIIIMKGSIKIEIDHNTPFSSIEPLLKSLL